MSETQEHILSRLSPKIRSKVRSATSLNQNQENSQTILRQKGKAASYEEMTLRTLLYNEACCTANRDLINTPDKSGV